jgi:hypothetical protein
MRALPVHPTLSSILCMMLQGYECSVNGSLQQLLGVTCCEGLAQRPLRTDAISVLQGIDSCRQLLQGEGEQLGGLQDSLESREHAQRLG